MDTIIKYDEELFLFLNGLGTENWDGFWLIVTDKLSSIPLYVLLLFLIFKKFGLKGTLITILCAAVMITCVDQLANLFKYGIMRPRPCKVEAFQDTMRFIAVRCGRYGYFSAHAANSMATAVFVGLLLRSNYQYVLFILLFWAALVGYSRIYLGVHYPGDVLTGWSVGALIGFGFYRLQGYLVKRYSRV